MAEEILEDGVRIRAESGIRSMIGADSVILAGEVEPATELADALRETVAEVHAIGDCTGLGLIQKAIDDATRVACLI